MLALFWWPVSVPFFLLMGAAVALGATGSTFHLDIPPWEALPIIAVATCLVGVIYTLIAVQRGWSVSSKKDDDLSKRLAFAIRSNVSAVYLSYGVLLCAPALFILTGVLWTWVIAGAVAFVVSLRDFAAIA